MKDSTPFRDSDEEARLDRAAELLARPDDPYDQLPLPIQLRYSRIEYLWLSDEEKATLVQRECDPDY